MINNNYRLHASGHVVLIEKRRKKKRKNRSYIRRSSCTDKKLRMYMTSQQSVAGNLEPSRVKSKTNYWVALHGKLAVLYECKIVCEGEAIKNM